MRFPLLRREGNARVDLCSVYLIYSSPQRTNNPYAQFDDRNYEMGDVQSTTNLTAGLSVGGQESMSDFYDEVIQCFPLSRPPPVTMGCQRWLVSIIGVPPVRIARRR